MQQQQQYERTRRLLRKRRAATTATTTQATIHVFYPRSPSLALPCVRPARPTYLHSWRGFGHGCNMDEHIGYGACLDGLCCTRHSIEKRNALRVVQFRGQTGKSRRDSRRRRSDRSENHHLGSPLSRSGKENQPVGGTSSSNAVPAGKPRGQLAGSSLSRGETTTALSRCHLDSAAIVPVSRSGSRDTTATLGVTRSSHRERTPLHFASERGELSLVDRWGSLFFPQRFR